MDNLFPYIAGAEKLGLGCRVKIKEVAHDFHPQAALSGLLLLRFVCGLYLSNAVIKGRLNFRRFPLARLNAKSLAATADGAAHAKAFVEIFLGYGRRRIGVDTVISARHVRNGGCLPGRGHRGGLYTPLNRRDL